MLASVTKTIGSDLWHRGFDSRKSMIAAASVAILKENWKIRQRILSTFGQDDRTISRSVIRRAAHLCRQGIPINAFL